MLHDGTGWNHPPMLPSPPPLTITLSVRRRHTPCVHRRRNKGALSWGPSIMYSWGCLLLKGSSKRWSSFWPVYYVWIWVMRGITVFYRCMTSESPLELLCFSGGCSPGAGEYVKRKIRRMPWFLIYLPCHTFVHIVYKRGNMFALSRCRTEARFCMKSDILRVPVLIYL